MRLWFAGMSGPNSLEDLKELLDPIRTSFDGVVWVLHDSVGTPEAEYLESIKGAGRVIHMTYCGRHDFSRNHYLYCGPIQDGDWVCQTDLLERLNPSFAANLRAFIEGLEQRGINMAYYHGKVLLYQYHESLEFRGTPHEGLQRRDGLARAVELKDAYPTETDIRWNVRPLKRRDPLGWMWHYARYYIEQPWGANHCLLGNENRSPDVMKLYHEREVVRDQFRTYLRHLGIPLTVKAFCDYLTAHPEDPIIKRHARAEKILNDLYRYTVYGERDLVDHHTWHDLHPIP